MKFTIEKIEYRPAKKGEWFWDRSLNKVCQAGFDCTLTMIILIGYEPEKFVLKGGERYYAPDAADPKLYIKYVWNGDEIDNFCIEHNLIYPYTEEGKAQAIAHAKRMLEV